MKSKTPEHKNDLKKSQILNDYFENHSSKLQFYTNISLVLITLLSLVATWYFSNKNLSLSSNQFKVAVSQFNYQRKEDSENRVEDREKERKLSQRIKNDSIVQSRRNKFQDQLNLRQLNINKQQLAAIKSQAQTAVNQLSEQTEQFKEQTFERKPYFVIDNISIDSSEKKYMPKISFLFSNKGVRAAHVDSTVLAFYNTVKGCASKTFNSGNLDAPPQQGAITTSNINIWKECLNSPDTFFYLLIYYRDFATDAPFNAPVFFQFHFNKDHQFVYSRLSTKVISNEFKSYLKKHNVAVINY